MHALDKIFSKRLTIVNENNRQCIKYSMYQLACVHNHCTFFYKKDLHWEKSHYPPANHHAIHLKKSYFQVITTCYPPVLNYHPRWCLGDTQSVRSSALVVSRWLWPGNRTLLEVDSMVVSWWMVSFWNCVDCGYVYIVIWCAQGIVMTL